MSEYMQGPSRGLNGVDDEYFAGSDGEHVSLPEAFIVSPGWGRFRPEDVPVGTEIRIGTIIGRVSSVDGRDPRPILSSVQGLFLGWIATDGESIAPGSFLARISRNGNGVADPNGHR